MSVGAHGRGVGAQSPELSSGPGVTVDCEALILVLRITRVLGDPISTAYRNLLKRPQHNIFLFMLIQSPMPFHRFSFANSYRYFHHNSTIYYLYYTTLLIVYIFPMIPLIILEVIL